jgi:hypothetical protein
VSIYLENASKSVKPPRNFVPVCVTRTFNEYWKPGAKALGLSIVPRIGHLVINSENKNTADVPILIEELKRLRDWFAANAPQKEQEYLLSRTKILIDELELIEAEGDIDIFIG